MPLPASWVDSLFARLSVRYGAAFLRQYEGIDAAVVKADWADVLDGIAAESIAYALRYLPAERPPTALQFRDLCRRAPRDDRAALPPPTERADPSVVERIMASLLAKQPGRGQTPAQRCYARIQAVVESRGGRWTLAQQHQVVAMHRVRLIDAGHWPFVAEAMNRDDEAQADVEEAA